MYTGADKSLDRPRR